MTDDHRGAVTSERRGDERIVALDVARTVAIVGMVAVNVGPTGVPGWAGSVYNLPHGRASVLFVLLAGVGLSMLTRRVRGPRGREYRPRTWLVVAWRAALVLVIGLVLQLLDHGSDVILVTYAVLFAVGGLVMAASDRVLLVAAGLAVVAGPLLWMWLGTGDVSPAPDLLMTPVEAARSAVLTGPYPVVTWLAPFLFGMWLGRRDLGDRPTQWRLAAWGLGITVGAAVVSALGAAAFYDPDGEPFPGLLVTSAAHGQMPLWLVGSAASAVAVVGVALLLGDELARPWARPLVATGQLALTIYVGHLLVLAALRPLPHTLTQGYALSALIVVGAVAGATAWRIGIGRGPLESLLRPPRRRR
ncbi:DUF418 domain-containing protein [Georgenia sp. Z1491]|uniref:DUF418 domain-containing protein n=1 Tax=Georgenia sp. Z1491 TaxID=3416707 RepID=UPI003CEF0D2A